MDLVGHYFSNDVKGQGLRLTSSKLVESYSRTEEVSKDNRFLEPWYIYIGIYKFINK